MGLKTIIELHRGGVQSELYHITAVRQKPKLLGVVTITPALKALYAEQGIPADKIFVWPDAVDVDSFDRLPAKSTLRQRLGFADDAIIATYCGHFYRDRGIEEILQCAHDLPSVTFLMIGGWQEDIDRLKKDAEKLSNVHFTGFVPNRQVPDYLGASDVLLMPYPASCETASWMSPMKLFEYMASGRPIVATDLPAIRRHLQHGCNAHLINPGDSASMGTAIRSIMECSDYALRLGQAARRDVSPYTWHNRARAIVSRFCTGTAEGERVVA